MNLVHTAHVSYKLTQQACAVRQLAKSHSKRDNEEEKKQCSSDNEWK